MSTEKVEITAGNENESDKKPDDGGSAPEVGNEKGAGSKVEEGPSEAKSLVAFLEGVCGLYVHCGLLVYLQDRMAEGKDRDEDIEAISKLIEELEALIVPLVEEAETKKAGTSQQIMAYFMNHFSPLKDGPIAEVDNKIRNAFNKLYSGGQERLDDFVAKVEQLESMIVALLVAACGAKIEAKDIETGLKVKVPVVAGVDQDVLGKSLYNQARVLSPFAKAVAMVEEKPEVELDWKEALEGLKKESKEEESILKMIAEYSPAFQALDSPQARLTWLSEKVNKMAKGGLFTSLAYARDKASAVKTQHSDKLNEQMMRILPLPKRFKDTRDKLITMAKELGALAGVQNTATNCSFS